MIKSTIYFIVFLASFAALAKPPKAVMTVNPQDGYLPLEVTFDGSGSSDTDGSIVSYQWDFGDGTTANGPVVTHTYKTNRVENARLTVTDNSGKKGTTNTVFKFSKDRTPPVLSYEQPDNFQSLISTPIITIRYQDSTSQVDTTKAQVLLDGIDVTSYASFSQNHAILQFTPAWPLTPGQHVLVTTVQDYYENITTRTLHFSYVQTDSETAFLNGKVFDVDGRPLKGVLITSAQGPSGSFLKGVTDTAGKFSIPFKEGGDYKLEISLSGYLTANKFISLIKGHNETLGDMFIAEADTKQTLIGTAGGSATNTSVQLRLKFQLDLYQQEHLFLSQRQSLDVRFRFLYLMPPNLHTLTMPNPPVQSSQHLQACGSETF